MSDTPMPTTPEEILRDIEQDDAAADWSEKHAPGWNKHWLRDRERLRRACLALKAAEDYCLTNNSADKRAKLDALVDALASLKDMK